MGSYTSEEKLEGKTANEWFDLARKAKDPIQEIEYYSKVLQIHPKSAATWHRKGLALEKLERYGEASGCYDKATEINPHYAFGWYRKGLTLGKQGKYEEAIVCYDRAIQLDPNLKSVREALSEVKAKQTLAEENNLRKKLDELVNLGIPPRLT